MSQRILVPVDGSPRMPQLMSKAIDFAKKTKSTLTFLYVVQMSPEVLAQEIERQKQACIKIPEECREKATAEGVSASSRVDVGSPAETIINLVNKEKFNLVIIGSKGHSAIRTVLVGSVADQVMEHASCPVLLIR